MNEGYPLIVRRADAIGSRREYFLAGRRVEVPAIIEALLPGGEWLKVVVLDHPDNERTSGFVCIGVSFYGGAILSGELPREARFRWPKTLASKDDGREGDKA